MSSMALSHLTFIDEAFLLMSKKTSGFKSNMTPTQLDTLLLLREILTSIVHGCYLAVDYAAHATFAKDSLPYLLRIIETIKTLFNLNGSEPLESTKSLLEKGYVLLSEGTDFTYEKVYET